MLSINSFQHSYRKANIIIFEIQCNASCYLWQCYWHHMSNSPQQFITLTPLKHFAVSAFSLSALFDLSWSSKILRLRNDMSVCDCFAVKKFPLRPVLLNFKNHCFWECTNVTQEEKKKSDVISQVTEHSGGGGVLHPFHSFLFTVIWRRVCV